MINNYKEFKEYLHSLDSKPKLLLHACCGPCSTHTIQLLNNYFDITSDSPLKINFTVAQGIETAFHLKDVLEVRSVADLR